jgi:hypothetical protein
MLSSRRGLHSSSMAGMEGDPKDPNAWWAVKLPNRMHAWTMEELRKTPKKRLYWLVPLLIAEMVAVTFGLYKMGSFSR